MTVSTLTDSEARQRAASDFTTTFLVEAGAGTGKTAVLLDRLLSLLRTGRGRAERIAAITFSEKSAAELRQRLRSELELLLAGPLTEDERANLRSARWQLERAQISTVHAFCAMLLRERPVEARVDPYFSTLDQFEARLLQAEVWREWIAQEMDQSPQVLKQALRMGLTLSHIETLRDFVLEHRDCIPLVPEVLPLSLGTLHTQFHHALLQLRQHEAACRTETDRALIQIRRLAALVPQEEDETAWERILAYDPKDVVGGTNIGAKTNWRPAATLEEVRHVLQELGNALRDARANWLHNLSVQLTSWLNGYLQAYEERKREQSQLDFTDLLLLARDVLKTNLDVRRYFQRKFDYLLVDEFQDTDPLQAEIVFFLAEQTSQATAWTAVTLRPGKLFLVGDPQQSIYRFRRADLDVYKQVRGLIAHTGELLTLSSNFRTRAPILTWMNETFAPAFAETGEHQSPYQPLAATRHEETGREVIMVPVVPESRSPSPARDELRQAEARTIAALLKQAITYGNLAVWGDKIPEYRDIAILFRTHRVIDAYEEALRHAEIPYRVSGGRRYANRPEIEDLRVLLRAIEQPTDPLLIVAVLRSSVFGFSDEEIAFFVCEGGKFDALHPIIPASLPNVELWTDAFALLRTLHHDAGKLSPASLLYKIYNQSHLIPVFALRPQGMQRVANLLKLIDITQALALRGVVTLAAVNRFLSQQEIAGEEDEAFLSEENDNVVRLMTVHKAKGLEFPLVVLADMAEAPTIERSTLTGIIERLSGTLELRIGPRPLTCTTLGWQKAEEREQGRELAEEWRLRYVATARARDHLLIPILFDSEENANTQRDDNQERNENERGPSLFSLSGSSRQARVYTYRIDPTTIQQLVPREPMTPLITQVPTSQSALQSHERWQAERQELLRKGRGQSSSDIAHHDIVPSREAESTVVRNK
jgi:ATP-dependent helicase/nuclease subunit A